MALSQGVNLARQDAAILRKVLQSTVLQNLIGAEEWDLTESEEMRLWVIIEEALTWPAAEG